MACGCGDRMRKYILPFAGYVYRDGVWINDSEEDPNLREISDEDINNHHARLTVKIIHSFGKEKFRFWWHSIGGSREVLEDAAVDSLVKSYENMKNKVSK